MHETSIGIENIPIQSLFFINVPYKYYMHWEIRDCLTSQSCICCEHVKRPKTDAA